MPQVLSPLTPQMSPLAYTLPPLSRFFCEGCCRFLYRRTAVRPPDLPPQPLLYRLDAFAPCWCRLRTELPENHHSPWCTKKRLQWTRRQPRSGGPLGPVSDAFQCRDLFPRKVAGRPEARLCRHEYFVDTRVSITRIRKAPRSLQPFPLDL